MPPPRIAPTAAIQRRRRVYKETRATDAEGGEGDEYKGRVEQERQKPGAA
jgi:hypothetical protein